MRLRAREITSPQSRDTRPVWKRPATRRNVLLGIGLPVMFLGTGWTFLTQIDGWLGVLLWMVIAVPLCFLVEFVVRPRHGPPPRSPKSNPRMRVRTPVRGDPDRRQPATRTRDRDFPWHEEKESAVRKRRRTYAR